MFFAGTFAQESPPSTLVCMIPNQTEDPRLTTPRQEDKLQEPRDTCPDSLESVARAELNSTAGRVLTDGEWGQARARLLQFVELLHGWHRAEAHGAESW
jgi:hypothetical protein